MNLSIADFASTNRLPPEYPIDGLRTTIEMDKARLQEHARHREEIFNNRSSRLTRPFRELSTRLRKWRP